MRLTLHTLVFAIVTPCIGACTSGVAPVAESPPITSAAESVIANAPPTITDNAPAVPITPPAIEVPTTTQTAPASRPPESHDEVCAAAETATTSHVFDGDTIAVRFPDGHEDTVRYIGINTPEVGEDCAREATEFHRALVKGNKLHLLRDVRDRDIYGRLLRYVCTADRVFVNAELVAAGYAHAVKYPPDTRFASLFERLEDEAAKAGRGCLHRTANTGSESGGSLCCKICRNGKPCGDTCIPFDRQCTAPIGCACSG